MVGAVQSVHAPSFFLVFLLAVGLFDPSCIGFPQSWHRILPLGPLRLSVLVSVLLVLGVACEVMQGIRRTFAQRERCGGQRMWSCRRIMLVSQSPQNNLLWPLWPFGDHCRFAGRGELVAGL